jgi:glycosyltransferase involved in cell wall biosynthesis
MNKIPFLLLGDGPAEPTGLGRIARDLAGLIYSSDLPLDLVQVGGSVPPLWRAWPHAPLNREEDWGAREVQHLYRSIWGGQPGILFAIWDPSRLYPYTQIDLPVQKWAYCAIDGANVHDEISGPARVAVQSFDRVLAYGRYGANVLERTTGRSVPWLPHGLQTDFGTTANPEFAREVFGPHAINRLVVGSVMTNQPRKEFGLLFESIAILIRRGWPLHLWLHTDTLVKDWAVQQLTEDFGLAKRVTVTTGSAQPFTDESLSALYHACTITLLPSLGEGFGYPIVESLACGTPVVHSQCAGGETYVPRLEWRVPIRERRLESVYAIVRPVMTPEDWANAAERALRWRQDQQQICAAYCKGSVDHLRWTALWGRWRSWIKQGLQ